MGSKRQGYIRYGEKEDYDVIGIASIGLGHLQELSHIIAHTDIDPDRMDLGRECQGGIDCEHI